MAFLDGFDAYSGDKPHLPAWKDIAGKMSFVILKTSELVKRFQYTDNTYGGMRQGARGAGMIVGSYHFFHTGDRTPGTDHDALVDGQADAMASICVRLRPGDLGPSLDLEHKSVCTASMNCKPASDIVKFNDDDSWDAATWFRRLKRFLDRIETRLGRQPMIYTSASAWSDLLHGTTATPAAMAFGAYPLWVVVMPYGDADAGYTHRTDAILARYFPPPWGSRWHFRQYSDHRASALNPPFGHDSLDVDTFNGTLHQLRGYADLGKPTAQLVSPGVTAYALDTDGHVTHVRYDAGWKSERVPGVTAAADLSVATVGDTEYVAYVDTVGDVWEVTRAADGTWAAPFNVHDEAGAPECKSEPVNGVAGDMRFIFYWGNVPVAGDFRGKDVLAYCFSGTQWSYAAMDGVVARGTPTAYVDGGNPHAVVRSGDNGHLFDAWYDSSGFHHDDLCQNGAEAATYRPAMYWGDDGRPRIVYRAVGGDIVVIHRDTMLPEDLSVDAAVPVSATAAGGPAVFVLDGVVHVMYRGVDGHLHELYGANTAWTHRDVTAAAPPMAGAELAADPAAYAQGSEGHVLYRGADGKLYEHVLDASGWRFELTA
jgi:GH25 family lysozyme M1 (1,4-beta-N-acetylmuramidase)